MSQEEGVGQRKARIIRLVVSRRERAPRSPRMQRALKRLIWRYNKDLSEERKQALRREDADR
jgi:hypothetical protein